MRHIQLTFKRYIYLIFVARRPVTNQQDHRQRDDHVESVASCYVY